MKNTLVPAAKLAFAAFFTSFHEGGMCLGGEGDAETRTLGIRRIEECA